MITLFLRKSNDNLFEERKWLVDELGFNECFSLTACFFSSLTSCQIYKINFAHDNFFWAFDFTSDFKMNCKNAMTSGTVSVEFMLSDSTIILSLKKHLKGFFLIFCRFFRKTFDNNIAFWILLNVHLVLIIFVEEITECFIIKFEVGNWDLDLMFIPWVDFLIKFRN